MIQNALSTVKSAIVNHPIIAATTSIGSIGTFLWWRQRPATLDRRAERLLARSIKLQTLANEARDECRSDVDWAAVSVLQAEAQNLAAQAGFLMAKAEDKRAKTASKAAAKAAAKARNGKQPAEQSTKDEMPVGTAGQ